MGVEGAQEQFRRLKDRCEVEVATAPGYVIGGHVPPEPFLTSELDLNCSPLPPAIAPAAAMSSPLSADDDDVGRRATPRLGISRILSANRSDLRASPAPGRSKGPRRAAASYQ